MLPAAQLPPELLTPQQRERFFRHVLQDTAQPLEERVAAMQEVVQLAARDENYAGLAAPRPTDQPSCALREPAEMYRLVRAAWEDNREAGLLGSEPRPELSDEQLMAVFISAVVRNPLEGIHDQIPNPLMKQLNILIRNGAYTALHAARTMGRSQYARGYVSYRLQLVPPYWEAPQLLDTHLEGRKRHGEPVDESDQTSEEPA